MRRALSLVLSFILCAVLACSCASAAKVEDYLGEYDYEAPAICMVYEPVEGEFDEEGNALYGIQYREVTDLEGLLKVPDTTFLLYFYNSLDSTAWTVTAVVEDIAEAEEGKLVVVALVLRRRNQRLLSAYIESITYDTENAKNSTLLNFPLPIAVFRLSDSSVVWGNDNFFSMFGVSGSRVDAKLAALIPGFSGKWLMEGKNRYPSIVEIAGKKYQLHGNLIRAEGEEEESAIMGITYWLDVTDYDNTRILYESGRDGQKLPGTRKK